MKLILIQKGSSTLPEITKRIDCPFIESTSDFVKDDFKKRQIELFSEYMRIDESYYHSVYYPSSADADMRDYLGI
jgi:phosphomevalonate kinase